MWICYPGGRRCVLLLSRRVEIGFFGLKGWKGGKGSFPLASWDASAPKQEKKGRRTWLHMGKGVVECWDRNAPRAAPLFLGTRGTCLPPTSRHSLLSVVQSDSSASAPRPPSMNRASQTHYYIYPLCQTHRYISHHGFFFGSVLVCFIDLWS